MNTNKLLFFLAGITLSFQSSTAQRTYPFQWLWGSSKEDKSEQADKDWITKAPPLMETITVIMKKDNFTESDLNTFSIKMVQLLKVFGEPFSDTFVRGQLEKMTGAKKLKEDSAKATTTAQFSTATASASTSSKTTDTTKTDKEKDLEAKNKILEKDLKKAQLELEALKKSNTPSSSSKTKPTKPSTTATSTATKDDKKNAASTSSSASQTSTDKKTAENANAQATKPKTRTHTTQALKTADQVERTTSFSQSRRGRAPIKIDGP